ncbi:hypothetical protein BCU70_18940 [Vibrio sp. 10N.286.49.C2]|uniref:hypothetical protein n=1 Tax=unclassified Vibrio TaxID=2614977 RepID=UPI000C830A01|nr:MULTISPECIES: hypothetical protein [unclassified Vibrio]PMH35118.1 hypothetical protein BCU70_18940 [Vibrio sp. 10N.286.49.C2]PMH50918.1 hypothetical protein BCU66_17860 [Vibrio sp. 10N.286.49.B1]PMH83580.1 hypothetical protein BCU58_14295 [Vibrio sp. 10N.286.48.B7]
MFKKILAALSEAIEFRSRIWVVHVSESLFKDQSYVVNEDGFDAPLEWMHRKGYSPAMLEQVEQMKRSQVLVFNFGHYTHQLMRVK